MRQLFVYILKCSDDTFYTGVTNNIDRRLDEHNSGRSPGSYTYTRRPVKLMYHAGFTDFYAAIAKEKQIKRWSNAKKQALIDGRFDDLVNLAKKRF